MARISYNFIFNGSGQGSWYTWTALVSRPFCSIISYQEVCVVSPGGTHSSWSLLSWEVRECLIVAWSWLNFLTSETPLLVNVVSLVGSNPCLSSKVVLGVEVLIERVLDMILGWWGSLHLWHAETVSGFGECRLCCTLHHWRFKIVSTKVNLLVIAWAW